MLLPLRWRGPRAFHSYCSPLLTVIPSAARDLGVCPRRRYRWYKLEPGSLATLGMTSVFRDDKRLPSTLSLKTVQGDLSCKSLVAGVRAEVHAPARRSPKSKVQPRGVGCTVNQKTLELRQHPGVLIPSSRRAADALLSGLAARGRCNRDIDGIRCETTVGGEDHVVPREVIGGRTELGAGRICV
jgi:hypothetical protein